MHCDQSRALSVTTHHSRQLSCCEILKRAAADINREKATRKGMQCSNAPSPSDSPPITKEKIMSTLVAVVFNDESTAFDMRAALARMQKQYLLDMEDAVVVTRDTNGKTRLHQAVSLTGAGAVGGAFWGMLIGLLFLNPLLGAAVGAGAGALSGKFSNIGIDNKMMKDVGDS